MPFQNITGNQFGQAGIPTSVAVLYTVPPNTRSYLKDIDIANNTPGDIQVTVYLVPAGVATPDPLSNVLVPNVTVPRYGQYQWTGTQIIGDGATIQMVASAIGCTINASGGEAV
jgi:hypothetical protein